MTNNEMLAHVDHTQLKPFATWADIEKLCEEAITFKTASVCVPPAYIKRINEKYGDKIPKSNKNAANLPGVKSA